MGVQSDKGSGTVEELTLWIEVDFELRILEKGSKFVKVTLPKQLDVCSLEEFVAFAEEEAKKQIPLLLSDDNSTLRLDSCEMRCIVKRAYADNGAGEPNVGCPIELGQEDE